MAKLDPVLERIEAFNEARGSGVLVWGIMAAARTAQDKTVIQRQIDATDNQIEQLVYQLYNLTNEEIKIVEEGRLGSDRR